MAEHHFNIDSTQVNPTIEDSPAIAGSAELDDCYETAHLISNDAWYQAGFVLVTTLNSVFALGYSGIIMVPLGWIGGTIGLVTMALLSLYANHLLARLHEIGGERHIRYRDLAGHIYGRKMYYITWTLQFINLFMANIGFIIFAGQAIKVIYNLYTSEDMLKLPYCITIGGLVCIIFGYSIPHLSGLRLWLAISTILSLIYIITSIVLSIKDGVNSPARDYGNPKTKTTKVFSAIGAAASLAFPYNTGMLPEIQDKVKSKGDMLRLHYSDQAWCQVVNECFNVFTYLCQGASTVQRPCEVSVNSLGFARQSSIRMDGQDYMFGSKGLRSFQGFKGFINHRATVFGFICICLEEGRILLRSAALHAPVNKSCNAIPGICFGVHISREELLCSRCTHSLRSPSWRSFS